MVTYLSYIIFCKNNINESFYHIKVLCYDIMFFFFVLIIYFFLKKLNIFLRRQHIYFIKHLLKKVSLHLLNFLIKNFISHVLLIEKYISFFFSTFFGNTFLKVVFPLT